MLKKRLLLHVKHLKTTHSTLCAYNTRETAPPLTIRFSYATVKHLKTTHSLFCHVRLLTCETAKNHTSFFISVTGETSKEPHMHFLCVNVR